MDENMKESSYEEGLFTYDEWKNACILLEAEIDKINKNKHFNTINLQYYNFLPSDYRKNVGEKEYFEKYIKNYLFYGLEDEVFNYIYYIQKNPYAFRKISYNSYVARLIHYGIGLYLYKITESFENGFIATNKSIKSWYGGKIKYTSLNTISIKKENLYYRDSYKAFSKELIKVAKENVKNRIVIKLDIQDFYDNILVENFLKKLKKTINYSTKNTFYFDDTKIKCIADFYRFIMNGKEGIPQSDNDIISSFISNIYMKLVDIEILKCIKDMHISNLKDYSIIQYCDDTYIVLDFEEEEKDTIYIIVKKILQKISLILIHEFNIKFNTKSQIFNFSIQADVENFMKCIKINSQEEMELAQGERPQVIFESIIEELNRINNYDSTEIKIEDSVEVFKKIYNDSVKDIMNKPENLNLLEKTIEKLEFNKIFLSSKYIVTLACKNMNTRQKLLNYIENEFENNLNKLFFALEYIAKEDIEYRKKILTMIEDESYKKILEFKMLNRNSAGYINIEKDKIEYLRIYEKPLIINQIKYRRIAENSSNYNIAFNHLVNEVKSIVNYICSPEIEEKEYNAKKIKNDLIQIGCSIKVTVGICNMFDRRNNNTISHSNGEIVTKEEYYNNKKYVEKMLEEIINSMENRSV